MSKKSSTQNPSPKKKISEKTLIKYGAIGVVLLIVVFIALSWGPRKGPMTYGICKTFLTLQTAYPQTLKHVAVERYSGSIRIYYTEKDPFGEHNLKQIQCYFEQDPGQGLIMTKVTIDRRDYDPDIVKKFSDTIPLVVNAKPNLDLP